VCDVGGVWRGGGGVVVGGGGFFFFFFFAITIGQRPLRGDSLRRGLRGVSSTGLPACPFQPVPTPFDNGLPDVLLKAINATQGVCLPLFL